MGGKRHHKRGGRQGLASEAIAVRERLREWYVPRFGTQQRLAEAAGVEKSTVEAWFRTEKPATPQTPALHRLAAYGLSVDWLLTGRGEQIRDVDRSPKALADDLRSYLLGELARAFPDAKEATLSRLLPSAGELVDESLRASRAAVERAYRERRRAWDTAQLQGLVKARVHWQRPDRVAFRLRSVLGVLQGMLEEGALGPVLSDEEWLQGREPTGR